VRDETGIHVDPEQNNMKQTTRKLVVTLLILSLAPIAGCGSALRSYEKELAKTGRDRITSVVNGLGLVITPRKKVFTMDEQVIIDIRIFNDTNSNAGDAPRVDINVYTELLEGFLIYIDARCLTNKDYSYKTQPEKIDPVADLPRFSHYVRLQPGYSIGRPIHFSPIARGLKPGIYEMTVTYSSNLDSCLVSPRLTLDQLRLLKTGEDNNEGFVKLWKNTLVSNTIVFEIKKGSGKRSAGAVRAAE